MLTVAVGARGSIGYTFGKRFSMDAGLVIFVFLSVASPAGIGDIALVDVRLWVVLGENGVISVTIGANRRDLPGVFGVPAAMNASLKLDDLFRTDAFCCCATWPVTLSAGLHDILPVDSGPQSARGFDVVRPVTIRTLREDSRWCVGPAVLHCINGLSAHQA